MSVICGKILTAYSDVYISDVTDGYICLTCVFSNEVTARCTVCFNYHLISRSL